METILEITLRSIAISGTATLLSASWGVPIGILLGLERFRGRFIVKGLFNALLGLPTVTLGLLLYLVLSRAGPLGFLHLLYTPLAISIGQSILITPIMVSFVTNSIESVEPEIKDLAKTLGASETQASLAVLRETKSGFLLAITASFSRAIAELGIALMLGRNLVGKTRVLTTFIALTTDTGDFAPAIALGVILLMIVSAVSLTINFLQRHDSWSRA